MYARGMSTRDIHAHIEEPYGIGVSAPLVSAVSDAVLEDVFAWQNRPLEPGYAIVYFDALWVKVRDEGLVRNKGHFPSDEAATKLIYLALRNITAKWKKPPKEWHAAKAQFAIQFGDRFALTV